jgi:hypothetical protein
MGSTDSAGWNGAFMVPLNGQLWQVIIGDGSALDTGWRHLSVTNAQRRELPPWEVMCRLKDLFFADDAWVVQFHPPKEVYVNDHPYVLHLWEPLDAELPTPNIVLV